MTNDARIALMQRLLVIAMRNASVEAICEAAALSEEAGSPELAAELRGIVVNRDDAELGLG
ncbi:hypothetical protein [Roseomonas indoligenes]|uniref:Uncharacterized protein n=1 Tax=Roseomonas indoligenes TaxID=2820811 RepID=A0A940MUD2_9PROT|nr:hypothetical protein [Pararoseomonas indoligenes]MBP0492141.1 hypothetical protein [Pararoseomonas indoligenes]